MKKGMQKADEGGECKRRMKKRVDESDEKGCGQVEGGSVLAGNEKGCDQMESGLLLVVRG